MAAYGYIRVSTIEQARDDRTSLESQRRNIGSVADLAGLEVTRIFEEPGISGRTAIASRPAGAQLLAALQPGDTIITPKMDRLFRSAADALNMAERWKKHGIRLIIADMGITPVTENGASQFFFTIMAAAAQFERDRITERTAEGRAEKIAKGGHGGGHAPFGFRIEGEGRLARLEPLPEFAPALATIRELHGEGKSLRSIAVAVQERHGHKLSHTAVQTVLRRKMEI